MITLKSYFNLPIVYKLEKMIGHKERKMVREKYDGKNSIYPYIEKLEIKELFLPGENYLVKKIFPFKLNKYVKKKIGLSRFHGYNFEIIYYLDLKSLYEDFERGIL